MKQSSTSEMDHDRCLLLRKSSEFRISENRIPKTEFSKTEFPKSSYVQSASFPRSASRAFVIIRNDLPYRLLNLKEREKEKMEI